MIGRSTSLVLAIAAALLLPPAPASAQEGKNAGKVRQALEAAAQGQCPATLMAPQLRGACLQQMPGLSQMITSRGALQSLEYLGDETLPTGVLVEVYRVIFEGGSMTWTAASGPDGKLNVLWSNG